MSYEEYQDPQESTIQMPLDNHLSFSELAYEQGMKMWAMSENTACLLIAVGVKTYRQHEPWEDKTRCELVPVQQTTILGLEHPPEPTPEHLAELREAAQHLYDKEQMLLMASICCLVSTMDDSNDYFASAVKSTRPSIETLRTGEVAPEGQRTSENFPHLDKSKLVMTGVSTGPLDYLFYKFGEIHFQEQWDQPPHAFDVDLSNYYLIVTEGNKWPK